jgi:hypothetical protein
MGLDYVEFVMAVEESFGIEIPDEVAEELRTPGMLKDYVYQQLIRTQTSGCLSQRAFYALRKSLKTSGSDLPDAIRPSTRWEELAPPKHERQTWWKELQAASGLPLPSLVRPMWVVISGCIVVATMGLTAGWSGQGFSFVTLGLVWLIGGLTLTLLTRPMRTRFQSEFGTISATARHLSIYSAAKLKSAGEGWTRHQVSDVINQLIIEQLGIQAFDDNSDFVRDLKVG